MKWPGCCWSGEWRCKSTNSGTFIYELGTFIYELGTFRSDSYMNGPEWVVFPYSFHIISYITIYECNDSPTVDFAVFIYEMDSISYMKWDPFHIWNGSLSYMKWERTKGCSYDTWQQIWASFASSDGGGRQSSDLPMPVLHCFEYLAMDLPVSSIPEHLYPRHGLPSYWATGCRVAPIP